MIYAYFWRGLHLKCLVLVAEIFNLYIVHCTFLTCTCTSRAVGVSRWRGLAEQLLADMRGRAQGGEALAACLRSHDAMVTLRLCVTVDMEMGLAHSLNKHSRPEAGRG